MTEDLRATCMQEMRIKLAGPVNFLSSSSRYACWHLNCKKMPISVEVPCRDDKESTDGGSEGGLVAEIKQSTKQLTFRAIVVGLSVGSLLCCSNTYFGLQSGW